MSHKISLGPVLRHLRGDQTVGEGPIEVLTRSQDFNLATVEDGRGQKAHVPAQTLIVFTAVAFREIGADDHWEFRVVMDGPSAMKVHQLLYLHGTDILTVRAAAKVAL